MPIKNTYREKKIKYKRAKKAKVKHIKKTGPKCVEKAKARCIGRVLWNGFGGERDLAESQADICNLKGVADDARLVDKTILLAGVGAVGGKTLTELARMGVGTIFVVDPDIYEADSWLTQPCRRKQDLHREKAVVQGAAAAAANPAVKIITTCGDAQDLPWRVFRRADMLVVAGDNLELLVFMGKMATAFRKPLVEGCVHGESFTAFTRHWNLSDISSACPACAIGDSEWYHLRSRRGCDMGAARRLGQEATRTLPFVCSAAASFMSGEIVKCLLGDRSGLANEELAYCLKSHRLLRTPHERNDDCRCEHTKWDVVDVNVPPRQLTLAHIIGQFADSSSFLLSGELPWISFGYCERCEDWISVRMFGKAGDRLGRCVCGASPVALPQGLRSVLPADDLDAIGDVPLDELGLMPGDALRISSEQQELCIFTRTEPSAVWC